MSSTSCASLSGRACLACPWRGGPMYGTGWYQVTFERDLTGDVTPAAMAGARLVLVRTARGLLAADAVCPHRGAHLALGGRLDGESIVCPMHGYRISLGGPSDGAFR